MRHILLPLLVSAALAVSMALSSCSDAVREAAEETGGEVTGTAPAAGDSAADDAETAAEQQADPPSAPASPWDGYTIIRSDLASDDTIAAVVAMRKAFQAKGVEISLGTDFIGRNETVPESGKEILVGSTTRPASDEAMSGLRLGDWRVGYDPSTGFVTVAGGSVPALAEACGWLAANAAGGPQEIPEEGYEHREDYVLADFVVFGSPLSEYTLVGVPEAGKAQKLFVRLAAENCGANVKIDNKNKKGPVITFLTDDTIDGYRIETKGGMMAIYGSDQAQFFAAVADMFGAALGGNGSVGLGYSLEGKASLAPVTFAASDEATLREAISQASDTASRGLYDITIRLGNEIYLTSPIEIDGEGFGVSKLTFDGTSGAVVCGSRAFGASDFRQAELNGVVCLAADLPEGAPLPRDAFIVYGEAGANDSVRLTPASLPEDGGYYHVAGIPGAISLSDFGTFEGAGEFNYREDLPAMSDPASAQMVMYHYWEQERFGVKEIDSSSKLLTLNGVTSMNLMSGGGGGPAVFRLENVREAMNQPGEFYIDRVNRKLYVIPEMLPEGGGFTVWLPCAEQAFIINNMYDLSFLNVSFTGFGWDMESRNPSQGGSDLPGVFELTGCDNCSFLSCDFSHVSYYAVKAVSGVSGLKVMNCVFRDIGSGAVHLGGENSEEGCVRDCVIKNNVINGYGRDFADGIGVLARYVNGGEISHNDISDGYYTGVSCGWTWGYSETVTDDNRVSYNHIHNIGQGVLSDLGGIYTLGPQAGTVLQGNVIHDIDCRDYGGWGIYLDEGSSGILVTENLCYRFNANAFHQHYGRENLIVNNIFALGEDSCVAVTRKENHVSFILERNILLQNGADIYNHAPSDMRMKDYANLIWDMSGTPMSGGCDPAQMRMAGYYDGCVIEDPLFIDPLNGDFTLGAMSPAYKIGFNPFDTSLAGLEK